MNWLADENVDLQIVEALRRGGHSVWYAAESAPSEPDDLLLELAVRERATLLTADKDFGALVFHQRRLMAGVVLLRLSGMSPDEKAARVAAFVRDHAHEIGGAFTVVTRTKLRFRLAP